MSYKLSREIIFFSSCAYFFTKSICFILKLYMHVNTGKGGGNKLLFTDVHLYVMLKAVHTLITGPHILTGVRT